MCKLNFLQSLLKNQEIHKLRHRNLLTYILYFSKPHIYDYMWKAHTYRTLKWKRSFWSFDPTAYMGGKPKPKAGGAPWE